MDVVSLLCFLFKFIVLLLQNHKLFSLIDNNLLLPFVLIEYIIVVFHPLLIVLQPLQ